MKKYLLILMAVAAVYSCTGGRDADALRSIFGIPEGETIMAVIALGYRAVDPQRPARKPLDEIVKFF